MPTINDMHYQRWVLVRGGKSALPFNPDFALPAYWLAHGDVGSPVGPEVKLDDGTTAQAFTNCVLVWTGSEVKRA